MREILQATRVRPKAGDRLRHVVGGTRSRDNAAMERGNGKLDSQRIRQAASLRRSLYRTRSYAIIAAIASITTAAQCGLLAWRHRASSRGALYLVLAAGCVVGMIWLVRRATQLTREARRTLLSQPSSAPDFSLLSDGSQRAENLDHIE
jgi:hypothetical protein